MGTKRYIYLLRHGETEYGKERIYLGHTDCKLSQKGMLQADSLGHYFSDNKINIEYIFSSDLIRCKSTVEMVFPKRDVRFLKELREINMGEWDGLTFTEVQNKYPEEFKKRGEDIADFYPPKGESFRQCQERAIKAFNNIINSTCGNVAICCHAGFIKVLLCSILKIDIQEIFKIKQDYCCINVLTIEESNLIVEDINIIG